MHARRLLVTGAALIAATSLALTGCSGTKEAAQQTGEAMGQAAKDAATATGEAAKDAAVATGSTLVVTSRQAGRGSRDDLVNHKNMANYKRK